MTLKDNNTKSLMENSYLSPYLGKHNFSRIVWDNPKQKINFLLTTHYVQYYESLGYPTQ